MENLIDGLVPDFSMFGADYTEWWQKLYAVLLLIVVVGLCIYTTVNVLRSSTAGAGCVGFGNERRDRATKRAYSGMAALLLVGVLGFAPLAAPPILPPY